MDHTSAIYLMDAKGGYSGIITYDEPTREAATTLRALLNR
jgi:cytochrome oxidase Cu insertion factor (SCO1/SenC/PrrC family)